MNMRTGKLTEADFDDIGLAMAVRRQQAMGAEQRLAWKCNQGRGPAEHVSQVPPHWFGRAGRGPQEDVEPRAWTPNAVLCFWASYAIGLVGVGAFIAWAAA